MFNDVLKAVPVRGGLVGLLGAGGDGQGFAFWGNLPHRGNLPVQTQGICMAASESEF